MIHTLPAFDPVSGQEMEIKYLPDENVLIVDQAATKINRGTRLFLDKPKGKLFTRKAILSIYGAKISDPAYKDYAAAYDIKAEVSKKQAKAFIKVLGMKQSGDSPMYTTKF